MVEEGDRARELVVGDLERGEVDLRDGLASADDERAPPVGIERERGLALPLGAKLAHDGLRRLLELPPGLRASQDDRAHVAVCADEREADRSDRAPGREQEDEALPALLGADDRSRHALLGEHVPHDRVDNRSPGPPGGRVVAGDQKTLLKRPCARAASSRASTLAAGSASTSWMMLSSRRTRSSTTPRRSQSRTRLRAIVRSHGSADPSPCARNRCASRNARANVS